MSKRKGKQERFADGFIRTAKRARRSHIAGNVATTEQEAENFRLRNADQYRMVCGDRTLAFVGKLPGGMNGSVGKPDTKKRFSNT